MLRAGPVRPGSGRAGFRTPGATIFRHAVCKRRRLCQGDRVSGFARATVTGPVASGSGSLVFFKRSLRQSLRSWRRLLQYCWASGCGVDGSASGRRARENRRLRPSPGRRWQRRSPWGRNPGSWRRHFHRDWGARFGSLTRDVFRVVVTQLVIGELDKPCPNPRLERPGEIVHSDFLAIRNVMSQNGAVYGAFT